MGRAVAKLDGRGRSCSCYTLRMKRGIAVNIVSIAFIGVASAFVLLRADPEYITTISEDGRLMVTGFAREGGVAVAQAYGDAGDEFVVTSGAVDHTLPLQLRFAYPSGPAWTGAEHVDVLWYDDASTMWEWQDATMVDSYLTLRTMRLGRFALADRKTVAAPDFMAVYDGLRENAPASAVGYRIAVGYIMNDGPRIRLDGVGQQGGCNGAVQPGEDTAYATATRTANVLVNDVQTPVTFTFMASWYVVDGGSCPEGQTFEASNEYGILPASY